MSFKFNPKAIDRREMLLEEIVTEYGKYKAGLRNNLFKLQKELRLLDKISDEDAKAYYRQLEKYIEELEIQELETA